MGSIRNSVYYCCIWNYAKVLFAYNNGIDLEIDNLAALCLQKTPPHHKWYFQTISNKTFGFLTDEKFVYFSIVDKNLGNPKNLEFLENVRHEFNKVSKKGSKSMNSVLLQAKLKPLIIRLIASLEAVFENHELSPSPTNDNDIAGSTNTPLLGKPSKHEKKKTRDHVISVRENNPDSASLDADNLGDSVTGFSITKEVSSVTRSSNETLRNKWCRHVRIVLAVDAAVCLILLIVWLVVCGGTECLR